MNHHISHILVYIENAKHSYKHYYILYILDYYILHILYYYILYILYFLHFPTKSPILSNLSLQLLSHFPLRFYCFFAHTHLTMSTGSQMACECKSTHTHTHTHTHTVKQNGAHKFPVRPSTDGILWAKATEPKIVYGGQQLIHRI